MAQIAPGVQVSASLKKITTGFCPRAARIDYWNSLLYGTIRSGTSTVFRRYKTRWLASCIRLPFRRAPRLCANSCTRYRSDNGSRTSWRPLLSRRSTVGPHCIFANSFETIRLPEHFDLGILPLHCFTDHLCPPSSPLGRSATVLCTSSLELSRDIHKIGEHFQ